ncbi:phage replisome organizer N-terminal domain-containing protein [Oceanivirga miroungae]|uniref:phage replisome organizer N-terminal domain-containing protein n=1 Tax=Oceanivirga miroungae TaxID=1130046 RepID=UPI0018D0683D|nr:phage replisome organizer N-terminal domain-containing protein [Oceanivirga miroungae]
MAKRYKWLKLQDDFFDRISTKKILKEENSYELLITYIMLQVRYIKTEGVINKITNYDFYDEIALSIDCDVGVLKQLFNILEETNVIEINTNSENESITLLEVVSSIGSESESAERVRKHRQNKKEISLCNTM